MVKIWNLFRSFLIKIIGYNDCDQLQKSSASLTLLLKFSGMKTIIALTDLSPVSINAIYFAADMAWELNAELILLHVTEMLVPISEIPVEATRYDGRLTANLKKIRNELLIRTQNEINITTRNPSGVIMSELKKLCKQRDPFAIVLARRHRPALERFLIQSITLYAARHLKYPVLVVPENATYKPIKNIGLACDLADTHEIPLHFMRELISAYNASLHVLHVSKTKNISKRKVIEELHLKYHLMEFNPEYHIIENEDVQVGIFSFARDNAIDLVIIMPHKHTIFEKKETKEFVFQPTIPILTLHKKEKN